MKRVFSICGVCFVVLGGLSTPARGVLAIDPRTPTTLYVGTATSPSTGNGISKSTDGGTSWAAINSGLPDTPILTLAIDPLTPTVLYATGGHSGDGIFKSTDSGTHWTVIHKGLSDTAFIALAIDPQTPTTLYAATNRLGISKSTDGGATWTAINSGFSSPTLSVPALPIDPRGLRGFRPPMRTSPTLSVPTLAIDPLTPTILYAGTKGSGVFKSTDGGMSWTAINSGLPSLVHGSAIIEVSHLAIDPRTPTILYATTGPGIFKSTQGGTSWTAVNDGLPQYEIDALALDPQTSTTLYVAIYSQGVFKSADGGTTWTASNNGLPLYFESHVDATNIYVDALAIDPKTPTTLYAQAWSNGGDGIFKSTDGGATWTFCNLGAPGTR